MAAKHSFLVIKYPRSDTAVEALKALQELSRDKVVKLKDAVALKKTLEGKLKIEQTKDDSAGRGFLKGGAIGVMLAVLFGPAGWIALGATSGALLGSLDRGIKNKLLKELGQNLKQSESAVAILIEEADWETAFARMKAHGFGGQVLVSEIVAEDLAEVEKLLAEPKTAESVPEVLDLPAPDEAVAVAAADQVSDEVPAAEPTASEASDPGAEPTASEASDPAAADQAEAVTPTT